MSDLDPVIGKLIFQNVLRWTPVLMGLVCLLEAASQVQTQQLLAGGFLGLVGLGLLILPFTRIYKDFIEIE